MGRDVDLLLCGDTMQAAENAGAKESLATAVKCGAVEGGSAGRILWV